MGKWQWQYIFLYCVLFVFLTTPDAYPQFNHPELTWKVIETPHFLIHYHQNEESFARNTARIAEELYQKQVQYIGYSPRFKIPVIIENYNDTTGGYTSIFTRKIVIQAQSDPFQTAGTLNWIKEVLGHELVHYLSFAAIDESIVPLRKAMVNMIMPMWFVEGLAQYLAEEWHSLKEMVVGEQARENRIMSEGELGSFYFFDGWGRMSGYYQSDSFVRYIFDTYGKDKIAGILLNLRRQPLIRLIGVVDLTGNGFLYPIPRFPNFDQALKECLGKNSLELYGEWREHIIKKYKGERGNILPSEKLLLSWGRRIRHPVFSPDGQKVAFASDKGYDFAIFDLYLMELTNRKVRKIATGIDPYFSFSPDGKYIVYSKTQFYSPKRAFLSDLYKVNIKTGKIERLTWGERASQPVFSLDGKSIVFVKSEGGNSNLYLLDLKKGSKTALTFSHDGLSQNFSPSFSPEGDKIAFVRFEKGKRDIYLLEIKGKKLKALTRDLADDRSPVFSPDGEKVFFVSNREKGSFNLFSYNLKNGEIICHLQVKGGIFEPRISPDGEKIIFSGFEKETFSLYLFSLRELSGKTCKKNKKWKIEEEKEEIIGEWEGKSQFSKLKTYPYRPELNLNYIFPWFSVSEEESFFSLDFYASDILEKHQVAGSAYLSEDFQFEMLYLNHFLEPTIWMDLYHLRGWSSFQDEVFLTYISGGTAGFTYFLNDSIALETFYFSQKLDTQLFNYSLDLVPWRGMVRGAGMGLFYFNQLLVREPELLPRGTQAYLGLEWAGEEVKSDLGYRAGYFDLRNYWFINKKQGFALRLTGRRVENTKREPRLAFSLGGWGDLRGYPEDYLVGENLAFASAEYRFDWWRRIGGSSFFYFDSVGGCLFFDAGSCWREEARLDTNKIKRSAGFELRFRMLPFGKSSLVLRMGMAWPFDYDRKGRFFLALGGVF